MFMSAASDVERALKALMVVDDGARQWLQVEGMLTMEELDPNKDTKESTAWQVQAEAAHAKKTGARIGRVQDTVPPKKSPNPNPTLTPTPQPQPLTLT